MSFKYRSPDEGQMIVFYTWSVCFSRISDKWCICLSLRPSVTHESVDHDILCLNLKKKEHQEHDTRLRADRQNASDV